MLAGRFSGAEDGLFDKKHREKVERKVDEYIESQERKQREFDRVKMSELKRNLKRLKNRSSPGKDGIHNNMLKHLPDNVLEVIVKLCNMSFEVGKIPKIWKESVITMIPKGGGKVASDPNSYRPISLLSCLGKLVERIMNERLVKFLNDMKIIIAQQSGF